MYEIFEQLLQKYGVSAYKVAKATGVTQSTLSDWKRGRSTPKTENMKKLADYFGVSIDYLMTGEETDIESKVDYVLSLENGEMALLEDYRSLPDPFKLKARTYVETLTRLHSMEQPLLNAAHAIENASSDDKQYDEDIMDDENF